MHRIEITKDGSQTVFSEQFQTTFHSIHGAMQESLHVFIRNGFECATEKFSLINILEVGFGTGLNAILTFQSALKKKIKVNYTAVEKYPLENDIYTGLNYFKEADLNKTLLKMHEQEWNFSSYLSPDFCLEKIKGDAQDLVPQKKYELVYFDAFAPSSQEEMWTEHILRNMYNALEPSGILVTFCAKGDLKRTLRAIGFKVESLPGAPGKREMTRALKPD
jgi:tRNA U34 5-methylaminomethyl-2-thiouridine-forming methyltransferase MnmC